MKNKFIVAVPHVPGVSKAEMADYIRTAVSCWIGGGDPDDPIYRAFAGRVKRPVTVKPAGLLVRGRGNNPGLLK